MLRFIALVLGALKLLVNARELVPNAAAVGSIGTRQFMQILFGQQIVGISPTRRGLRLDTPNGQTFQVSNIQVDSNDFSFTIDRATPEFTAGIETGPARLSYRLSDRRRRLGICAIVGNFALSRQDAQNVIVNNFFLGLTNQILDNLQITFGQADCSRFPAPGGVCNNREGAAFQSLLRWPAIDPQFADGISEPNGQNRPSPRLISNIVSSQGQVSSSTPNRLTYWFVSFGQFLDHDIGLSPAIEGPEGEEFPIEVPEDEPLFDTNQELRFSRLRPIRVNNRETTPRQFINTCSALIDGGQVYGNTWFKAIVLRTFQGGQLLTSGNGLFMPRDGSTLPESVGARIGMDPPGFRDGLFAAGDQRANENEVLASMHTLWVREHNLVANELSVIFPDFSDEALYQFARRVVIAELQSITFQEWLPRLLGQATPDFRQRTNNLQSPLNSQIQAIFSGGAFRFGHSLVTSIVRRLGPGNRNIPGIGDRLVQEAFFNPFDLEAVGIEAYIRGAIQTEAQNLDHLVIDNLRNFLFRDIPEVAGIDLVAFNIQRGRDFGLPDFLTVRRALSIRGPVRWRPGAGERIARAYGGSLEDIDLFIGLMAEAPSSVQSLVGPTMEIIIREQFERFRDGDSFWFTDLTQQFPELQQYPRAFAIQFGQVRMNDIITRNTDISPFDLPFDSAFTSPRFFTTRPSVLIRPFAGGAAVPLQNVLRTNVENANLDLLGMNFTGSGQGRGPSRRGPIPQEVETLLSIPRGAGASEDVATGAINVLANS